MTASEKVCLYPMFGWGVAPTVTWEKLNLLLAVVPSQPFKYYKSMGGNDSGMNEMQSMTSVGLDSKSAISPRVPDGFYAGCY